VVVPLATGQLAPSLAVLDLMVGLLLMLAGVGAWLSGLAWRIGIVSALAGLAWFGPDLFAVRDVDPWLRILGQFVLSPLRWPILLHLGVAHLGLDRRRDVRAWLLVLYGATATMVFASSRCTSRSGILVHRCQWDNRSSRHRGDGRRAGRRRPAAYRLGGARDRRGHGAARVRHPRPDPLGLRPRPRATTLAAMSLIGTAAAVRAWSLVVAPIQDPREQVWLLDWWTLATGASLLAGTVVAAAIATWQRRERMGRLADSLVAAPKPGALARELALALGDPELTIAYVTSEGRLVDPDGEVITTGDVDRVATPIEREGTVLAHVHHSPATDRAALAAAFGPTLLVALDNERLRATQLARLSELRRSRARIVAVADAARRGLERDLHDGVQQQLIALVFDLRSLRLAFERSRDPRRVDGVAALEARAQTAIDELRRIAHGIHPAILSRSGLEEALLSLAEESPAPVKVRAGGLGRLPDAIESAAYAVAPRWSGTPLDGVPANS